MIWWIWHTLVVGHRWRFYCKSCVTHPMHTFADGAAWHCDCGARR